jgi:hypothetical protein
MNEPTSSGFRPTPPASVPAGAVNAQAQQLLTFQQNTAGMLDTVFRLTLAASQHAQHVVLPGTEAKIAEMQGLLAKEVNLAEREKALAESKNVQAAEKEKHAAAVREFDAVKLKWKADREAEDRTREQQRYARYVEADQLLLPSALRTDEAKSIVDQLIPVMEGRREGWRLRAALTAVAVAEIGNEEEDLMKAVQDLFQPSQSAFEPSSDLPGHLKRLLSNHGKDPIIVEIPAAGEAYNPATMSTTNPELSPGRPIARVLKWGVKFANKDKRKRALVA